MPGAVAVASWSAQAEALRSLRSWIQGGAWFSRHLYSRRLIEPSNGRCRYFRVGDFLQNRPVGNQDIKPMVSSDHHGVESVQLVQRDHRA